MVYSRRLSLSSKLQPQRKVAGSRLAPAISLSLGLSSLLFAISAGMVARTYFNFNPTISRQFTLQNLSDQVIYLDEVLTMSARMGSATGNLAWEERYNIHVPKLDEVLAEIERLDPVSYEAYAAQTTAANIKLVDWEVEAFDLIRAGEREQAFEILHSPDYEEQKRIYAEGINQTIEEIRGNIQASLILYEQELLRSLILSGISFPILLVSWATILILVRNFVRERNETYERQASDTRLAQRFADIARIRQDQELIEPLTDLLSEIRQRYAAERVAVYRLTHPEEAQVIAEARGSRQSSTLGAVVHGIPAPLQQTLDNGQVYAFSQVPVAELSADYLQVLATAQLKAEMVAPVMRGDEPYGFLGIGRVQSYSWSQEEQENLAELASRLGQALSNLGALEQKAVAAQERERSEALQQELLQLINDVMEASRGDLTVRAQLTAGQIGIVADFFNAIIESLRDIVIQVQQAAGQVNNSVGNNEAAIRELADAALKQATQIGETLRSVEQMTLSIQEVADKAQQAAAVSESAAATATASSLTMDRTVQNILQLRETVAETAKKVKRLGESSQQISKVVSLINQIALKTNLLAVNASIEAARAGEEGRGFAVVAEEVGALAAQSAEATREIERIVEGIQRETGEVVQAMETGTSQVVEGTRLVEDAKQSLGQIVEVSRQVNQLFQAIAQSTDSQADASQMVRQLMEQIASIATHTSEASQRVANSLQDTVAIARQLQTSVSTFKVGEAI
ncbi:MAG: methyl-accepting chemotaxis protein [Thermostichus sp. HHBFW_bins_43]